MNNKNYQNTINNMNRRTIKCELYNDSYQNWKKYPMQAAQLIIADIPYNVGDNFYGSNPMWYINGDNANGESKHAKSAAFYSDYNFNIAEFFSFITRLMKAEPTKKAPRGRSSDAPCLIMFCSFEQQQDIIKYAAQWGFKHYIPLTFIKNYSPQVLKANMRVVGATEHALVLYRDKLPKFRNGVQVDENGKNVRGTGHMVFDWMPWEKDPKDIPKLHPTQKPQNVLRKLIETFTDPGDVVIDPVAGSGSTLRACQETGRTCFGFEIAKDYYNKAKNEMLLPWEKKPLNEILKSDEEA